MKQLFSKKIQLYSTAAPMRRIDGEIKYRIDVSHITVPPHVTLGSTKITGLHTHRRVFSVACLLSFCGWSFCGRYLLSFGGCFSLLSFGGCFSLLRLGFCALRLEYLGCLGAGFSCFREIHNKNRWLATYNSQYEIKCHNKSFFPSTYCASFLP